MLGMIDAKKNGAFIEDAVGLMPVVMGSLDVADMICASITGSAKSILTTQERSITYEGIGASEFVGDL